MLALLQLFDDPLTAVQHERHIHFVKKITQENPYGILIKDVALVAEIVEKCAKNSTYYEEHHREELLNLVSLLGMPLLMEKASDSVTYESSAIESYSRLGNVLGELVIEPIKLQICRSVFSFCMIELHLSNMNGLHYTDNDTNMTIVNKGTFPTALAKYFAKIQTNRLNLILELLDELHLFSVSSDESCDQLVKAELPFVLCRSLVDTPPRELIWIVTEILFNLLEKEKAGVIEQLASSSSLSGLQEALLQQLSFAARKHDKQLRNDLLIVVLSVAEFKFSTAFVTTGLLQQLCILATFQDVRCHHALVQYLKLTDCKEDFEMKKVLMQIIVLIARNSAIDTLKILSKNKVLLALFSYVQPLQVSTTHPPWTRGQYHELQVQAIIALCSLAPLCIDDYMDCHGGTRMLVFVDWYSKEQSSSDAFSKLYWCIQLMQSLVTTRHEIVVEDLCDQGAINQLLEILHNCIGISFESEPTLYVDMQCNILFILGTLCGSDVHRKELFGERGVCCLLHYLRSCPDKMNTGFGHNQLLIITIHCVWSCVVGCSMNEDKFLEYEGIFLLLDLLEVCPSAMNSIILGCILDFCENEAVLEHIEAWRGKNGRHILSLLCQLWREEEKNIGSEREVCGVILSIEELELSSHPLSTTKEEDGRITIPLSCRSPAIVDVSANNRSKIYSLVVKTGWSKENLSLEDQVTIELISSYLNLKVGQVWAETRSELHEEKIRPVSPDFDLLESLARKNKNDVNNLATKQRKILNLKHEKEWEEEKQCYDELKVTYQRKNKESMQHAAFMARTANYNFLTMCRQSQLGSIDVSRMRPGESYTGTMHDTELPKLNVTSLCGKHVRVESTPLEMTAPPYVLKKTPKYLLNDFF